MIIRFYRIYSFVQVGFNKDGKLQALDITMYSNDGYVSEIGWAVSTVIIFVHSRYGIRLFTVLWPEISHTSTTAYC